MPVNNARRISQGVQPGPFDLADVPVVNGAGEIALVVRDLRGKSGVGRVALAASQGERQGLPESGHLLQLGIERSTPRGASMALSANKRLDGDQGWSAAVTANIPLDDGIGTSSRIDRAANGELSGMVSAARRSGATARSDP